MCKFYPSGNMSSPLCAALSVDPSYSPDFLAPASEVAFRLPAAAKHVAVRDIKAEHIGRLVQVKGIVTRATEVKPMLRVATYTCDQCGAETYQPVSAPRQRRRRGRGGARCSSDPGLFVS